MPVRPQRKAAPEPPRPCRVDVRFTAAELADLRERAGRYSHGNLSAYLRDAGLHRRMDPLPPPPPAVNLDAWREASRGFGLLNQTMAHLNKGNIMVSDRERAALSQLLAELMAAVNALRLLLVRRTA